jgi:hypothetical protein
MTAMAGKQAGEISAGTLEAYRRAGSLVAELMDRAEARRLACTIDGLDPWTTPPATRAVFLCAWNAFVLQALGSAILEADRAAAPATAGLVPSAAADEAMACFAQVEGWMDRAYQAEANPDFRLDRSVPADLPWSPQGHGRHTHVQGLLRAMRIIGERAAAAVALLPETASGGGARQEQLDRIRQLFGAARHGAQTAAEADGAITALRVWIRVEPAARAAIQLFHEVGQLAADPTLASGAAAAQGLAVPDTMPLLPGEPGFDPLILTAPAARVWMRTNPRAREAMDQLWTLDPDPARTLAIQAAIQAAVEEGRVVHATDRRGRSLAPWYRCPWSPVYEARRMLRLGGVLLLAGEQFVYEVGAPAGEHGSGFTRCVRPGRVHPTRKVKYLDSTPAA